MPLLLTRQINDNSAYAVWNIQETFLELPYLSPETFPANLHPVRQAEWIVGRILVKRLCEFFDMPYHGVSCEATGKPYLAHGNAHISISHHFPMATAMIHLHEACGIDVEKPREQLRKVKDKFLHPSERSLGDDKDSLCKIWSAKEVIYKIYGRKALSLKDDIRVEFTDNDFLLGYNLKNEPAEEFRIACEKLKSYFLLYNVA
jgi:phosphopantetheinyl transferase